MKAYVGITDQEWFNQLSKAQNLTEVNFWQPSGKREFNILAPGDLFLFKLHHPQDFIVGGGFFAHASIVPISLAWEAFGQANGTLTLQEMRQRVAKYRSEKTNVQDDYLIGCRLIEQPFFLPRERWIPTPADWSKNIVQGKTYDLAVEPGLSIWRQLQTSLNAPVMVKEEPARYGSPTLTFPRLGQGSFRILVTDAYERRCAVTSERTLPALEAAHIKPFSEDGPLDVNNGILLRRDLHALFDRGYLTITPQYTLEVSRRIKEEFENGREYYKYQGAPIRTPSNPLFVPSLDFVDWHNHNVYRG